MWLLVVSRSRDYWLRISPSATRIALVDVKVCLGIPLCVTRWVPRVSRGLILGSTGRGAPHYWEHWKGAPLFASRQCFPNNNWHCFACIRCRMSNSNVLAVPGILPPPLWIHWRQFLLRRRLLLLLWLLLRLRLLVCGWFYHALLGCPGWHILLGGRQRASRSLSLPPL